MHVAVVTGASRGLGAGVAQHFHEAGLSLGLCARSEPVLPDGDRVVARRVDVTDAAAVDAFTAEVVDRFGRIDLWVNNAGVLEPIAPLHDTDPAAIRHNLEVNVLGVVHGTQSFVRHVRSRSGGGVLVNISSGAATSGYAGWAAYSASKAAVERLTEVAQLEEGDHGLRAHAVSPGVVDTDMQALIRDTPADRFPAVERFRTRKAEGRFNTPSHVARHLLDLAFGPRPPRPGEPVRVPDEH